MKTKDYPREETWDDGLRRTIFIDTKGKIRTELLCMAPVNGKYCENRAQQSDPCLCARHKKGTYKPKVPIQPDGIEYLNEKNERCKRIKGKQVKLCIGVQGSKCMNEARSNMRCRKCGNLFEAQQL